MPDPVLNRRTRHRFGRRRLGDDLVLRPDLDVTPFALAETPPLLLLPLRLEYRVMQGRRTFELRDSTPELSALARVVEATPGRSLAARRERAEGRRRIVSAHVRQPFEVRDVRIPTRDEVWFRWYPDEGFAEKGIEPATEEEEALLKEFRTWIGSRDWWGVDDTEVSSAWQALAREVGPYRAVHLIRTDGEPGDDKWERRIGRVAALPTRVELFAVSGEAVALIGKGADIPKNLGAERSEVSLTYEAIETGGWLNDYQRALELGMGVKLTGDAAKDSLAADWIIAVGIFDGKAETEIQTLLQDRVANGEFEILPQDAPTNNSPNARAAHMDPRTDPQTFVEGATHEEAGRFGGDIDTSADILAEALGVDPMVVRKAVGAADSAFEDARAMLRVVGPALLDDAADGVTVLEGVDENEFIEVMAGAIAARGALPPLRSGRNAYGVVTLTRLRDLEAPAGGTEAETKVHDFLRKLSVGVRTVWPGEADATVDVIAPDDPKASDKIESILKTNRVSVRVDVADAASEKTSSIGCPYVRGRKSPHQPASYLPELREKTLGQLPDPTSADMVWPLLYRLARQSLIRNTLFLVVQPKLLDRVRSIRHLDLLSRNERRVVRDEVTIGKALSTSAFAKLPSNVFSGISRSNLGRIRRVNTRFTAALKRLEAVAARPNGAAQLEMLLMEVLDLLQHRVDAWATGLAYDRLRRNRQRGQKGLRAGYYGFLGKLRPKSVTGGTDGFVQAPSMAQATTAAVLRSAYLRHRSNGAFAINLRSRRARRAMAILDLLKKGLTIGEALGLRGERWLHEQKLSRLTLSLRRRFPVENLTPPEGGAPQPTGRRVFDGLEFLEGRLTGLPSSDRPALNKLKSVLAEDLDALSDLIVAEAVHQRTLGSAEAANAWLQVLSGESVPGNPVVIRTQRHGQGSTHRVTLTIPETDITSSDRPRGLAEPSLAKVAARSLSGFGAARVEVEVTRVKDSSQSVAVRYKVDDDLGMSPIDLVIGGRSELRIRARQKFVTQWLVDETLSNAIGSPPETGLDAFVNAELQIDVDFTVGNPSVDDLLQRAERLRRVAQRGRPLEPADLGAAADPSDVLTEEVERSLIEGGLQRLRVRAEALERQLTTTASQFGAQRRDFIRLVDLANQRVSDGATAAEIEIAMAQAEEARRALTERLWDAAAWAEPHALRPFTVREAMLQAATLDARLGEMEARLGDRKAALNAALASTASTSFTKVSEARSARDTLITAIQRSLDGEALPVLVPYDRVPALRPKLEEETSSSAALAEWIPVRSAVADLVSAAGDIPGVRAHPVAAAATEDDQGPEEADPRGEEEAPRARHFGTFLGTRASVATSSTVVGIVADEWAEQRPSQDQMAAMAINYDSPQSEPPHCLLLCVPPKATVKRWSGNNAAEMVFEAIQWMKIRALSTREKPTPAALLPRANRVAYKKEGRALKARIPKRPFKLIAVPGFAMEATFKVAAPGMPLGARKAGLNERDGFYRIEE